MEKQPMISQQELYASTVYYALKLDLNFIEEEMQQNEPLSSSENNSDIKNFWDTKVVNINRRKRMNRLSIQKNNVLDEIELFKEAQGQNNVDYSFGESKEKLLAKMAEAFAGENCQLDKAYFAIRFCLDNDVEYENKNKVWAEISQLLFADEHVISRLYKDLQENYIQIFKAPFDSVQNGILMGVAIASLLSAVAMPMLLASQAAVSPILTVCLSVLGRSATGSIAGGVISVTAQSLIYSSLLLGGTYLGTEIGKQLKIRNIRENFRKISPEDLSMIFAIKATIIQYARTQLDKDDMKKVLDDCLNQLNDLRSDAEYVLIVEILDAENSKKKIEICNRLTNRLACIVGL